MKIKLIIYFCLSVKRDEAFNTLNAIYCQDQKLTSILANCLRLLHVNLATLIYRS